MIRELIIAIIVIIYTFITLPIRLINMMKPKEEREKSNYKLLRKLICIIMPITGVKIEVKGRKNLYKYDNHLIIVNHKSDLDSLILIWLFERPIICKI